MTDPTSGTGPPAVAGTGAQAVAAAPARLRSLLEAHRAISSDLSLDTMLERIVSAACDLVGSPAGCLAVTTGEGAAEEPAAVPALEQLVQHGMDETTAARFDRELRTALRSGSCPLRFPGYHAVPIRVRGAVFGTLFLAQPTVAAAAFGHADVAGHTAAAQEETFDAADEELVTALAGMAGTAIGNARLYDEARRSRDWADAGVHLTHSLLSGDGDSRLAQVVERAAAVADVDSAGLILPLGGPQLQVAVIRGVGVDIWSGMTFDGRDSALGRAVLAGESVLLGDIMDLAKDDFDNAAVALGPMMIAPLIDARGVRGALVLTRLRGQRPFSHHDLQLASAFAAQAALSLEMDDARADREQLSVLEVRSRLAEDLHDNVMQRLFAIGMGLQGTATSMESAASNDAAARNPDFRARIARHVSDLDETIDEIRERVFGLRNRDRCGTRRPARFPHIGSFGDLRGTASEDAPDEAHADSRTA